MSPRVFVGAASVIPALTVACGGGDTSQTNAQAQQATAEATPAVVQTVVTSAPPVDLLDFRRPLTNAEAQTIEAIGFLIPGTDLGIRSIDLTDLRGGGPGQDDGIPALDDPQFVSQEEADRWLHPDEPVIAVEINGEARAYPLQILIWHEMVNDTLGGVPVVVTFCPLCNTAITFDRRVDGEVRTFGVSGLLRHSDLLMYDRTTESLWQQITGEAIVGTDTGKQLTFIRSQIVAWKEFSATFSGALVLSTETGYNRPYGQNPYSGYDRIGSPIFFPVYGFHDDRLDRKERVLTVEIGDDAVAFPFSALSDHVVLEAELEGTTVVAFWQPGALSALDSVFIIGSANIGAAGAFLPLVNGERLTFEARDQEIVDVQTGSVWNVLGRAISGPLKGAALEPVLSGNHFWFAWGSSSRRHASSVGPPRPDALHAPRRPSRRTS